MLSPTKSFIILLTGFLSISAINYLYLLKTDKQYNRKILMNNIMGCIFIIFGLLKIVNLPKFVQIFNKYDKYEDVGIHPIDSTGRSKVHYIQFIFQTGDSAQTQCYDFEEELRMKNNWVDGLSVTVRKKEVRNWLTNRK